MSLLLPDSGLVFWMLLAFAIVLVILCKYGFPVITQMVENRKCYIDESLESARKASEELMSVKEKSAAILKEAYAEHARIIKEAENAGAEILSEAKTKAQEESFRMVEDARRQIMHDRESAVRDIRKQVVALSVTLAEKIVKSKIDTDSKQMELIESMIDDYEKAKEKAQ